ncbi:hypothetical protein C5167_028694 [Papaver somniferum]|nr:hypothetical protein C5167_028694 [Papaver somniferum]
MNSSIAVFSQSPSSLCSSSKLDSSKTLIFVCNRRNTSCFGFQKKNYGSRIICSAGDNTSSSIPAGENSSSFCIIEGPETVQDFVQMQSKEIQDNIRSRRNKIFLLMEEVRRLRVQQRIKNAKALDESSDEEANEMPDIPSTIPFLPLCYITCFILVETKDFEAALLNKLLIYFWDYSLWWSYSTHWIGGTSYEDFIRSLHLPLQLRYLKGSLLCKYRSQFSFEWADNVYLFDSQVDPIVASFSGGAVGVISALMLIEVNNVEQQEKKRCKYCVGTGYLACARCSASGVCLSIEPISINGSSNRPLRAPTTQRCPNCSGAGKVMCPTCLCTGMLMAREHDPQIEPFE